MIHLYLTTIIKPLYLLSSLLLLFASASSGFTTALLIVIALIAALSGVASAYISYLTYAKSRAIHQDIHTANTPIGTLIESAEGRRVSADVLPEDRTRAERLSVELLAQHEKDEGTK